RVGRSIQLEQELVIDPALFERLPQFLPRITHVDVQWKRGSVNNELTVYRYDVMLFIDGQHQRATHTFDLDWAEDHLSVATLRDKLLVSTADVVTVRSAPNRRLLGPVRAWRQLEDAEDTRSIDDWRAATVTCEDGDTPLLDEFWTLAKGTGYVAH